MDYAVISVVALVVSALTLFSGFGLGTLLLPAFVVFFPVSIAVAATAIVHLVNNAFKAVLLGAKAPWRVVALFGIPAAVFAVAGAIVLDKLSGMRPIASYELGPLEGHVTAVKIVVAVLIAVFSLFEFVPRLQQVSFDRRLISLGGVLSGFFGGLSGHQGALRSAFLMRAGLDKDGFIATSAVTAVVVDVSRLIVYGLTVFSKHFATVAGSRAVGLVVAGTVAALVGALLGVRFMKKVTMGAVQAAVGVLLLLTALALAAGII